MCEERQRERERQREIEREESVGVIVIHTVLYCLLITFALDIVLGFFLRGLLVVRTAQCQADSFSPPMLNLVP